MVFRRDNKGGDAFQRQISALRQQLGGSEAPGEFDEDEMAESESPSYAPSSYSDPAYDGERERYSQDQYGLDYDQGSREVTAEDYGSRAVSVPQADSQMTVVSHDTSWKGEIESAGSMHIHGRFEGVIRAEEDVYILEEAQVSAEVTARNVVIAGNYDGEVNCSARFEVLPTGRVKGSVRSPVLVVHDGAEINGSIQMTDLNAERPEPTSLVHRREAKGAGQA